MSSSAAVREQAKSQAQPFSSSMNKDDDKEIFKLQKSNTASPNSLGNTGYEEESSSAGIILFFILLLLLPAAGIYYFLSQETSRPYQYIAEPEIIKNEDTQNNENVITAIQKEKTESLAKDETESDSDTKAQDITTKENGMMEETASSPVTASAPLAASEYYADISQDEGEITITIHQPDTEAMPKQAETVITPDVEDKVKGGMKEAIKESSIGNMNDSIEGVIKEPVEDTLDSEIVPVIETSPVKPLNTEEIAKPIAKKKIIKEIVHVVVKGDTLWAIAKKYVNNPFLYPELARLSNIKNPHRIYPGNRVRIRFTNN